MPPHFSRLLITAVFIPSWLPRSTLFHTGTVWRSESIDHYKTLGLEPEAPAWTIKKQFYALSKIHHPDHNPDDPKASARFVNISEAYAVLGSPHKRECYDRGTRRASSAPSANVHQGSHSSSAPYGSRPPSGLSRRKTQFRGPPPSFYRNGGWGSQSAKRQTQAESGAFASEDTANTSSYSTARDGGFRLDGTHASWNNDVPHFDLDSHSRTQEQQDQRRRRRTEEEEVNVGSSGGVLLNFMFVGGVVSLACVMPTLFETIRGSRKAKDSSDQL